MQKFCGECGVTRAVGANFCGECGARFAVAAASPASAGLPLTKASPGDGLGRAGLTTSAGEVGGAWDSLQAKWWISGCFNVEGGSAAVGTRYFEGCDCYMAPRDDSPCSLCGRSRETSQDCISGHGDGVYPVFLLEDRSGRASGAIAFFLEDWALGVENKSKKPADILRAARPVLVGSIVCEGQLMFNDAYTGFDDRNVTVDVAVPAGRYEVIAWIAEVPTLRANDMMPFDRPVAMGVYSAELATALAASVTVDRDPQSFEVFRPWNTMTWGVMSHRVPDWGKAAMYNYRDDLARHATGRATSWMLQAAVHGDQDAQAIVGTVLASTDPSVVEERRALLTLRGQRSQPQL